MDTDVDHASSVARLPLESQASHVFHRIGHDGVQQVRDRQTQDQNEPRQKQPASLLALCGTFHSRTLTTKWRKLAEHRLALRCKQSVNGSTAKCSLRACATDCLNSLRRPEQLRPSNFTVCYSGVQ